MFSAKRRFSEPSSHALGLPKASLLVAALSVGAASCALQVHEGDGLATDGREVSISPVLTDAGPKVPDAGSGKANCMHLPLFMQVVMPVLTTKFEGLPQGIPGEVLEPQSCVSCHNGKKDKATLEMFMDETDAYSTCLMAWVRQFRDGDIVASSDPNMPAKEHEFKFKNPADYARFRDAVQMWIAAEGIVTMAKPQP